MSDNLANDTNYSKWFGEIKTRIQSSQQRAALKVNQELLSLYWFIGKALHEAKPEWGNKFITHLARDLKIEFPEIKGFSKRNLEQMRRWYNFHSNNVEIAQQAVAQMNFDINIEIAQQAVAQFSEPEKSSHNKNITHILFNIPWGHHLLILSKVKDSHAVYFYCVKTIQNGWSRNILQEQIESDLYRRQGQALTNFDLTLPDSQADLAKETLKNPYNFEFLTLAEGTKELDLERGLIQHMTSFLLELGKGFAYMGNQYNINVDGDDFFLDLLFFNTNLNRYVIFELKVGDFKPEYAGKLNMYINTVNNQVKKNFHEETIGVLLCKTPNKTVIEYSITGIKTPLGVSNYTIKKALPKEFNKTMPSIQELEEELATEIKIQKNPLEQKREKLLELINARNNPELKIQKSFILIKKIINTAFIKLISKIDDKIDDLRITEWYISQNKKYTCNNQEFEDLEKFHQSLIETSIPRSINYCISFNDFKKAGVNTFGNELRLIMRFSTNTYSISFNHGIIEELLYSQPLPEDKLVKLSDSIVNKLMDDIQQKVESIN